MYSIEIDVFCSEKREALLVFLRVSTDSNNLDTSIGSSLEVDIASSCLEEAI